MTRETSGKASRQEGKKYSYFRGFYRKILLWFWLAAALLIGAVVMTATVTVTPMESLPARQALYRDLKTYSFKIRQSLAEGKSALDALRLVEQSPGFPPRAGLIITSPEGLVITEHQELEPSVMHAVRTLISNEQIDLVTISSRMIVGPLQIRRAEGHWNLLLVWQSRALLWQRLILIVNDHPSLLVMALLASGFLCFLLVTGLVSPLRSLQRRVRQISDGNLKARLPQTLTERRDEVGELCRDFNAMAERLQAMDKNKERLLRDVSHELRSPLTRMQLALALARSKAGTVAESEHERMERDIDRLNGMIGQILQWSRMVTAAPAPGWSRFSLDRVIRELVDNADFEAAARGNSVVLMRCDLCMFNGENSDWLASAVENVVRNAVRFSPRDQRVEVRQFVEKDAVNIQIRDYGPGVPEDDLAHLFEPFFRVDETRGGDNSGTGLGMAIAHACVGRYGGTIKAENADPGLRVIISLPLVSFSEDAA